MIDYVSYWQRSANTMSQNKTTICRIKGAAAPTAAWGQTLKGPQGVGKIWLKYKRAIPGYTYATDVAVIIFAASEPTRDRQVCGGEG